MIRYYTGLNLFFITWRDGYNLHIVSVIITLLVVVAFELGEGDRVILTIG